MSAMRAFFTSPVARKLYVLALYALIGAAIQAGLLPPDAVTWLNEHTMELILTALGFGHVLPEAAKPAAEV